MIKLIIEFRNIDYEIFYEDGALYPCEDSRDVQYKLMTYYINLWKKTGYLSTGECVVCFEDNKIGTLMGCCNNKHFLCVSCISKMYESERYDCPCCRENMVSVMADRMANQLDWFQRDNMINDPWYSFFCNEAKAAGLLSSSQIIDKIRELGEDDFPTEDEMKSYDTYDEEDNTIEYILNDNIIESIWFWAKKSPIHFNKIQRKVGYKPMNMARMGGKIRKVI